MSQFFPFLVTLSFLALCFLIYPIYINRSSFNIKKRYPLYIPLLALPFSFFLYFYVSTWDETLLNDDKLPPVDMMVKDLESQLDKNPDDVVGWQLLGQSYIVMGLYSEAIGALEEAWDRSPNPSLQLKMLYAEAQVLYSPDAIVGFPSQIFNEILNDDPYNEKALWYGGLAALKLGNISLASQRWSSLLEIGVPEAVENILVEQINLLNSNQYEGSEDLVNTQTDSVSISIQVMLDDSFVNIDIPQDTPLFIFARDKLGGPPIAVIRDEFGSIPGIFYLSDNDLMIPGRSLLDFPELSLTARISFSGNPIANKGDIYGEASYDDSIDNIIHMNQIVD
tara:strand:- start:164 stop:1174 length:1011 start_codon:yes stop_codon:yes gene_type:complete